MGTPVTLERSISVLQRSGSTLRGQRFIHDDGFRPGLVVELDQAKWEELGKPDEITVAFYPGDALNDLDHPSFTKL